MKTAFTLAIIATSFVITSSAANAQLADKRSFLHPLGFWSNNYFIAQREVYPRFIYTPRDLAMEPASYGGWVLHERNW